MKKINLNELISIGLIIVIGCFIISFAANRFFDIDTDFLSASATFFAGVVAYKLFNDWRIQYRTELFERLKDRFSTLLIKLEEEYEDLEVLLIEKGRDFNDIDVILEIMGKVDKVCTMIENIEDELDFYEKLYYEFNLDQNEEIFPPSEMINGLGEITEGLSTPSVVKDGNEKYVKLLKDFINSRIASNKIIDYKINLSSDLHLVIIEMITDKKGD
ncbi:hypothetical protein KTH73_04530 [Acinetobacter courvalinii]|uniref:hypothetical protein n=1 Tax=Acinetobacter TaxID=469 RepID=UPI001038B241|nr:MULTISPECIES: hypothetical protein [Acinetobacter]MBJ9956069.1 hypothetical protein [Acinetobacter courvalinii]MCU4389993.1 hypothetical protein [Acinetobacter courvalinii]